MLSVSGIAALIDEPQINRLDNGNAYFNLEVVVPDKREKGKRHKHRISLYVGSKDVNLASDALKKNVIIQIHSGSWEVQEKDYEGKITYFNKIRCAWQDISVLGWFGNGNKSS